MFQFDWSKAAHIGAEIVAGASFLHTFLPPWDWQPEFVTVGLAEFPTAQKVFYAIFHNRYYRFLVYLTGWMAINLRSGVWNYISVKNPVGPNANVPTVIHAANQQMKEDAEQEAGK